MAAIMDTSAVMYTAGVTEPDLKPEIPIHEARNKLGKIIEKSRYFDGVTHLLNRGEPVAVVVSVPFYERAQRNAALLAHLAASHPELHASLLAAVPAVSVPLKLVSD